MSSSFAQVTTLLTTLAFLGKPSALCRLPVNWNLPEIGTRCSMPGLVTITANEEPSEEGFDCHAVMDEMSDGKSRPALFIGRPGAPHPAEFTAVIRLRYLEGMNKVSCPALVCCWRDGWSCMARPCRGRGSS